MYMAYMTDFSSPFEWALQFHLPKMQAKQQL